MELRQLELFVTVAEAGSIHQAARKLMLAQPSVSESLRKLERHVGTPLLLRSNRGISLTAAGQVLFDRAVEILGRIDSSLEEIRSAARPRRALRVGLLSGFAAAGELTSSIMASYARKHPEVDISVRDLTYADQFDAVANGEVEVAIARSPFYDDRLEALPLFTEPRVLCYRAGHRFDDAESLCIADVLDEPMLNLTSASSLWAGFWSFADERNEQGRTYDSPASTTSEILLALATGDGMLSAPSSSYRLTRSSANPMRAVPIVDATASTAAVVLPPGERTAEAEEFARCARAAAEEFLYLLPDATLASLERQQ